MSLMCPNCGNAENFLVKTLQMHLLRVNGGQMQPPQEEGRPALVEVLCDECDSSIELDALDVFAVVGQPDPGLEAQPVEEGFQPR